MTAKDLDALFGPRRRYFTYHSLEEELGAVAAGRKAMSYFQFPDRDIGVDDFYREVCDLASDLQLSTVLRKDLDPAMDKPIPHTFLFVLRDQEEDWRIPGFLWTMKTIHRYGWSAAFEQLVGELLGYSDEEIGCWLNDQYTWQVDWIGWTILFLMSSAQADNVRMLGARSIDPRIMDPPLVVFYSRGHRPIREKVSSLIPSDCEFLRASVGRDFFTDLFETHKVTEFTPDILVAEIRHDRGVALNEALRSSFQFFGPVGWR